jgi:hypothetical protein
MPKKIRISALLEPDQIAYLHWVARKMSKPTSPKRFSDALRASIAMCADFDRSALGGAPWLEEENAS